MKYIAKKSPFSNTMYEITAEVDGVEKKYNIVVAKDESELDDLVAFAIEDEKRRLNPAEVVLTYADKRRMEYPLIPDQLDLLYHGGYDAWKASIDAVKTKYPKP
jgi:hypothetical protein